MTLTIGRASGLRPLTIAWNGGMLQVEGTAIATTLAAKKVLRQQLLGHLGNVDDEWIPVIYTTDSTYDGLYRMEDVQVSRLGVETANPFRFSASLRPARSRRQPLVEVTAIYSKGTGPNSGDSATETIRLPAKPVGATSGTVIGPTETGGIYFATDVLEATPQTAFYHATPSTFYNGSCRIEVNNGTTWDPVVGRELDSAPGVAAWRLNNGLIRFQALSNGRFQAQLFTGSTWESTKEFCYQKSGVGEPVSGWTDLTILLNAPNVVIVRAYYKSGSGSTSFPLSIDIMLRRGRPYVEALTRTVTGVNVGWSLGTNETGVNHGDQAIAASASDADGNKYLMGSYVANSRTLASGSGGPILTTTGSPSAFPVVLGYITAIPNESAVDTGVGLMVGNETQRVIGL